MIVAKGTFTAVENHAMEGGFTITQDGDTLTFQTTEDFLFDGSPKPGFALFKGDPKQANNADLEVAAIRTDFLRLNETPPPYLQRVETTGVQTASLPVGTPFDDYDWVYLWCFQFPEPLGYAQLVKE